MTDTNQSSALTDQQIIEKLAEFIGWEKNEDGSMWVEDGEDIYCTDNKDGRWYVHWNPLRDEGHFMQVLSKAIGVRDVYADYQDYFDGSLYKYCDTPLEERCKVLYSAIIDNE